MHDHHPAPMSDVPTADDAPDLRQAITPDVELLPTRETPAAEVVAHGLWHWVLPVMFLLSLCVLILYSAPYLLLHWRLLDAQGEAEVIFLKRRAELRAEAEHADERLTALDRRVHLTSLGFREVIRKVSPSVVNVVTYREPRKAELGVVGKKNLIDDPETGQKYIQAGVGSGLLVKPGVVLTNHHVIKGATRIRVTFASGQSLGLAPTATAVDEITDLAVLRLPADLPAGLKDEANTTAAFADSDRDVQVGDWALAVGSPLGLRQTVTQGVISAKGRLLHMLDLVELLQTDAAINPGNSGGPLFDQKGRVVGLNVAIASDSGGNQGIGFAIPSNTARKICDQLLENGEVPRGYLGIALDDVPGSDLRTLKLDDGAVLVKDVVPNEAAGRAGLKAGDIVVRFNGEALSRAQPVRHFRQLIVDVAPGQDVALEVVRGGEKHALSVTIGKRPSHLP